MEDYWEEYLWEGLSLASCLRKQAACQIRFSLGFLLCTSLQLRSAAAARVFELVSVRDFAPLCAPLHYPLPFSSAL